MASQTFQLTVNAPIVQVELAFRAVACTVSNPTSSPIYVRLGASDQPTANNADELIPAATAKAFPMVGSGTSHCLVLGSPAAITAPGSASLSGLFDSATVKFLSEGEPIPSYGTYSFLSLSISELLPLTAYAGTTTLTTFDMLPWGGMVVTVLPDAASGQAVLAVNISDDGITFRAFATYALWPNIPATLQLARTARYVQLILNSTAIVGEAAISGYVTARATISEITQTTYTPTGAAISKSYTLTPAGSQQFSFVTVGLPAVSIAVIATAGTGPTSAITFFVEASSDLVNWRQATVRRQRMSQGVTLYRALGNLDLFIRVTITCETANANGTVYLSIPPEADLGYILNTIQQSLGDKGAPSNENQDIYHELDSIRLSSSDISTNTFNSSVSLGSIDGKLNTLTTINTSVNGTTTAVNNILTNISGSVVTYSGNTVLVAYNTWTSSGTIINTGYQIIAVNVSAAGDGGGVANYAGTLGVSVGSAGGITQQIYTSHAFPAKQPAGAPFWATPPTMQYSSKRGAGNTINSPADRIWLYQAIQSGGSTYMAFVVSATS